MTGRFTGRHMAAILIAFFGVVFAVNFSMASMASSTFGGVVVANSYVASQKYNRWLEAARAQDRLGWDADLQRTPAGRVRVVLAGPAASAQVSAIARHPLGQAPDVPLTFARTQAGSFVSRQPLPPGRWTLRLFVIAGDRTWRSEVPLE